MPSCGSGPLVTSSNNQLPGPGGSPADTSESRSPSDWLLLLFWRQKWVILLALVLAMGGAFVYLRTATKLYVSSALVQVTKINTPSFAQSGGAVNPASSFVIANSHAKIMTSDAVLVMAVEAMRGGDGKPSTTLADLKRRVSADVDRATEDVTLAVRSESPVDARRTADAVINAYKDYVLNPGKDQKLEQTYTEKRKQAQVELDAKLADREAMQKEHGNAVRQGSEKNSPIFQRVDKLQTQKDEAEQIMLTAQNYAADARRQHRDVLPATRAADPVDDGSYLGPYPERELQAIVQEINAAKTQADLLEQQGTGAEHPRMIGISRRLTALRRYYVRTAEQWEAYAKNRFELLKKQHADASDEASRVASIGDKFNLLNAEITRLTGIRDQWDGKIREVASPDVQVKAQKASDPSADPKEPSIPNAPKVYVIAIAMGLVLGMVGAAGREWLDDRMRSAGEIKSSLGMPLLAVIPQSTTKRSFSVSGQRVLLDPASDAAEAYRSLRTAIQFSAPDGLRTLMIASPNTGDGKTTLVSNLGIAMAQAGKKVCIVDADLRQPAMHEIYSIKTTLGLSTLLSGRSTLDGTIQKTNVTGLDILPCGPVPANPQEVLNSQEFGSTLDELADRYDIVLLDSPPVGAANDARVIAASCDASLLVLTAQKANRRTTEQARDALQGVGARIIGLVVNDVPGKTGGGGYGTPKALRQVVPGLTSQEYDILQARSK